MIKRIVIIIICLISLYGVSHAASPVVFFSDLTDGPTDGWEGSGTKGAAVSIWGLNFGSAAHTSYVTCGGQTLYADESGIAEWGATTNPTTARDLQRITFYLNSSMSAGATTISVTTTEGSSGTISFYTRSTGNIYFVATDGSNVANGQTTSTPWKTPQQAIATVAAGDVVYYRGGTYSGEDFRDTSSTNASYYCYLHFWENNFAYGTANNSISFSAYPGELPVFGDGTSGIPYWIRQGGYVEGGSKMDYWTLSKFKIQIYDGALLEQMGQLSSANHIRFVGVDATTTTASTGHGVCFWFSANDGQDDVKFYGNYVHHTGKPLDWVAEDGSGYRVGPIYFQGHGTHEAVDVGWNEFAYNNGQSQIYGHYHTDSVTLLKYHDNYVHHTSTPPVSVSAMYAVFGGGDDNLSPQEEYAFITTAYIYNNIFANNYSGFRMSGNASVSQGSWGNKGAEIYYYNNTHYQNGASSSTEVVFGQENVIDFRNNIFYTAVSTNYFDNGGPVTSLAGSNNIWYGLSAGVPAWDDSGTSSETDPLINATTFIPNTLESPGVNAGSSTPSGVFSTDYYGLSRSNWDIGAVEYYTNQATPTISGCSIK